VPYIFRKIFSRATFASHIICFCLASFRSYKASKMTILKMSTEQCNIFGIMADVPGGGATAPCNTFLESFFTSNICLVCLCRVPFRSKLASKLTILENSAYLSFWGELPTNYTFWKVLLTGNSCRLAEMSILNR